MAQIRVFTESAARNGGMYLADGGDHVVHIFAGVIRIQRNAGTAAQDLDGPPATRLPVLDGFAALGGEGRPGRMQGGLVLDVRLRRQDLRAAGAAGGDALSPHGCNKPVAPGLRVEH